MHVSAEVCVVDGGALLHKVIWPSNGTYGEVISQYDGYLNRKYGNYRTVCVVFDGYLHDMSTKNQEHIWRGSTSAVNVTVTKDATVTCSRDKFLRNPSNKEQLIVVLTNDLKDTGKLVFQSQSDADILIVNTTLEFASEKDVVVVADNTDIVVMLCFHYNTSLNNIFFCTERSEIQKVRAPKGRK